MELIRVGRLGDPARAPYAVVHVGDNYRLRHYGGDGYRAFVRAPLLLIPPLMVTSEIYDVAPDVSVVNALLAGGFDVWLVDFGPPEMQEGGLERTLDDHILAIDDAIQRVNAETCENVHIIGYSQGGMFAYQVAAYRRSEGIASIITCGSPVDIHRNIPNIEASLARRVFDAAQNAFEKPIEKLDAVPGYLTSTGFKVLGFRKEVGQLFDFVQKLHDRQALQKREARRRFLAGEGFVAWPGPALRQFIDEFVVHNRMSSGGFVIAGRTVSLSDIRVPVLAFYGQRDLLAQPPAVRAICEAAPNARTYAVPIRAGHFGLVVGSTALAQTWTTVAQWVRWQSDDGPEPRLIRHDVPEEPEDAQFDRVDFQIDLFYDTVLKSISGAWNAAGEWMGDAIDRVDALRWQVPRFNVLRQLTPDSTIGLGAELAKRAKSNPSDTFFLWKGRAFSYADADRRVNNIVAGLIQCGIRPGERVAVMMEARPSYLSLTAALNRLGSVAVLLSPTRDRTVLERAIAITHPRYVVADPDNATLAQSLFNGPVLVLGGINETRNLPNEVIDMETIDPDAVELPEWYTPNDMRARDLAMIMLTAGRGKQPRAARITNRRWAFSAYGTAASCTLNPSDTIYCCLPLHHPAGMLVAVGGALVGGSRLALSDGGFNPETFWPEVRRYGATVVFYAGEMLRALLLRPPKASDGNNPVRLFAGSGMRVDVWRNLPPRVLVQSACSSSTLPRRVTLCSPTRPAKRLARSGDHFPGSADATRRD
ncbi:MAG: alpha/beta fold hydrolase [Polyangiales bacterium]